MLSFSMQNLTPLLEEYADLKLAGSDISLGEFLILEGFGIEQITTYQKDILIKMAEINKLKQLDEKPIIDVTKPPETQMIDLESKHALGDIRDVLNNSALRKPAPEYSQRHITTLKGVKEWTEEEKQNHKMYNRIFQEGYSTLKPENIIQLAIHTKEDWLTDWVCPQVVPACKLNIAAELITSYQVTAEDLNAKTQEAFSYITKNYPRFFLIGESIELMLKNAESEIKRKAETQLKARYPDLHKKAFENATKGIKGEDNVALQEIKVLRQAFIEVEHQRKKKEITHNAFRSEFRVLFPEIAKALNLKEKPILASSQNKDYVFLGAAGSGKSTIANQFLTPQDKLESVILATDDYRGVILQEKDEKIPTDQVFTRTQDTAYSIKELVQARIEINNTDNTKDNPKPRPNIILDCVTLEPWHRGLLATNKNEIISGVACLDDISLVPTRAYLRAIDDKSGPADKGRQVNTTSLLGGHSLASIGLLNAMPEGVKTTLYDTNIEKGKTPPKFATVDLQNGKHEIEVYHLSKLSGFLCKAKVNVKAEYPSELYRDKSNIQYSFTFDHHFQAEQVLGMVKEIPTPADKPWIKRKPSFDMTLMEKDQPYAKISVDKDNNPKLEVLNLEIFQKVLNGFHADARVLKSLAMQIHWKSLDKTRENIIALGSETEAARVAISGLVPDLPHLMTKPIGYALHVMSSSKVPVISPSTLDNKGVPIFKKNPMFQKIPILIKDPNDKIWILGRSANGSPKLTEVNDKTPYEWISFPEEVDRIEEFKNIVEVPILYEEVFDNIAKLKAHNPKYQVLQTDEKQRRQAEHGRLASEFDRQYQEHYRVSVKNETNYRQKPISNFSGKPDSLIPPHTPKDEKQAVTKKHKK